MAEIHPSVFYFSPEFKKNYDKVFRKKVKRAKSKALKTTSGVPGSPEEDSQKVRHEGGGENSGHKNKTRKQKSQAKESSIETS
jgi:hypothetical protein